MRQLEDQFRKSNIQIQEIHTENKENRGDENVKVWSLTATSLSYKSILKRYLKLPKYSEIKLQHNP